MNILILSTSNPYRIAGVVALDIYKGLKKKNKVKILVKNWDKFPDNNISSVENFVDYFKKKLTKKIKKFLKRFKLINLEAPRTDPDYHVQDHNQTRSIFSTRKILKKVKSNPDVIIVLFMQNFLSYKNLYELNQITKAPIFLYMMDMAPMTGGCHYSWGCKSYEKQCGNCPAFFSNKPLDQAYVNWKFKKNFIEKTNLSIIAGTEWAFRQLKESSIFKDKQKHKLLLPVDQNVYKPANKILPRKQLGLPLDKKIIFFGAVSFKFKRKGFKEFIEALNIFSKQLSDEQKKYIHIAIAGNGSAELINHLPFSCTSLGYLSQTELARALQASDIFVSSSIEDSGPMIINQSIMCGTPVVAFEMGVSLDLVITGETGYRAELKNNADLAKGIYSIAKLEDEEYLEMSGNCLRISNKMLGVNHFSMQLTRVFNESKI